jgi:hypothetical protein
MMVVISFIIIKENKKKQATYLEMLSFNAFLSLSICRERFFVVSLISLRNFSGRTSDCEVVETVVEYSLENIVTSKRKTKNKSQNFH